MSDESTNVRRFQIRDESKIVWLVDIERFPYVRESLVYCSHRRGKPPKTALPYCARLVGYAELAPDARSSNGWFTRRAFWTKKYDRGVSRNRREVYARGGSPAEGVDPKSVAPGVPGEKNDRAVTARRARLSRKCSSSNQI
jgi:hypothetical protein